MIAFLDMLGRLAKSRTQFLLDRYIVLALSMCMLFVFDLANCNKTMRFRGRRLNVNYIYKTLSDRKICAQPVYSDFTLAI